tara:strand:- start:1392 stop:1838 length:447 start_codon:yes stop_codon:yes gene_type:complete
MSYFKLNYGFFSNPELHLNKNGVKPAWADMHLPKLSQVVELAKTSSNDVAKTLDDGTVATNDRRVIFFATIAEPSINQLGADGEEPIGYEAKVQMLQEDLANHNLAMSPSEPYVSKFTDSDGNEHEETRISFIVHAMKGSTVNLPTDY